MAIWTWFCKSTGRCLLGNEDQAGRPCYRMQGSVVPIQLVFRKALLLKALTLAQSYVPRTFAYRKDVAPARLRQPLVPIVNHVPKFLLRQLALRN